MSARASEEEAQREFVKIGLVESQAEQVAKYAKTREALLATLEEAGVRGKEVDKAKGNLLATLAHRCPPSGLEKRAMVARRVGDGRIANPEQMEGALKALGEGVEGEAELERAAGVGVEVSEGDVKRAVEQAIVECKDELERRRYAGAITGKLMARAKELQPWAQGRQVKAEIDRQMEEVLGPMTEEDKAKPEEKPKRKKKKKGDDGDANPSKPPESAHENGDPGHNAGSMFAFLPKPEQNVAPHTAIHWSNSGQVQRPANPKERLERHLKRTNGRIVTRFPPEPNGYLHIGHAKAMAIDFGFAEEEGGGCYLRFDDTNPAAEKEEYIEHIKEIVGWMGWRPAKVTFSSDYFDQLYELAVELIRRGRAYVCHQSADEMRRSRETGHHSPWRNRPVEESLRLFEEMRLGMWEEGTATLRMKQDMGNENANMHDLVAYRIKFTPHPRSGKKWCVYPSYDFTHCIVDALENITHSMCTLEFEIRRPSFYWLLDALDLYMPVVYEFARMSIDHNILSKRKLNRLIEAGQIDGWDDPRILTLSGLRRRGVPPAALNSFVRSVGLARSDAVLPLHALEHHIRSALNETAPRAMIVLDPVKLTITNMPDEHVETITCQSFPNRGSESPTYTVPFTKTVYIDKSDFRTEDKKGYYGLAPGKQVLLRYAYPVTCTSYAVDPSDKQTPIEIFAEYDPDRQAKPKGVLHWVCPQSPRSQPFRAEVRLYNELFTVPDPDAYEDWLSKVNPNSLQVFRRSVVSPRVFDAPAESRFQMERVGYFTVDPSSSEPGSLSRRLVLNRIVGLRESHHAKALRSESQN